MLRKVFLGWALFAACAFAQTAPAFNASSLVKLGDSVRYGSYKVVKIGDGVYQLNDPGDPKGKLGALGVDMYLIVGQTKALMIDLGNNYTNGYAKDEILPRKNAAEEVRAMVNGLIGKLPLEIALTHAHPDHDGMTGAFLDKKVTIWAPEGEDLNGPKTQHNFDPAVYTTFPHTKTFDLGGGRVVKPILFRGHTNGGTMYLLPKDMLLFTGDTIGFGNGHHLTAAASVKVYAEDAQKLVDYVKSTFSPYERYALRVYTGHSHIDTVAGFNSPNHDPVDRGYLDWHYVQDQATCANGILKGKWLVADSGLRLMERKATPARPASVVMLYGIGAIGIPAEVAYEAAGLKMPQ